MSFAEKVTYPLHFFGLYFFSVQLAFGTDKNVQSRRISVSSPYNRTAETDFGERKSEYGKNQREAVRLPFLNFELILLKSLNLNKSLYPIKTFPFSLFRSVLFWAATFYFRKSMMSRSSIGISLVRSRR